MTNIPDDSEEKIEILDLDDDGKISINESLRAEAGLLGEFTKQKAKRKGVIGWVNRMLSRLLRRVDNY
jgi:hypothetical protein